jgi:intracellular sulfur oxidation DsrE/DsrF family protein
MEKYCVVFHLDESGKARGELVLKNIENLISDLGENNVEIEVGANGEGIIPLFKVPNQYGERMERLASRGVRFVPDLHEYHLCVIRCGGVGVRVHLAI